MASGTEVYQQQGFGRRMGFGKSPALIIIDFNNAFADAAQFGGGNIPQAIAKTKELLAAARHLDLPIVFTTHVYAEDGSEDGLFNLKAGNMPLLRPGTFATAIVDDLAPRPGERIISKHYPSGFFCTDLASWLTKRGVDTAIVTGATHRAACAPLWSMPWAMASGLSCRANAPATALWARTRPTCSTWTRSMPT